MYCENCGERISMGAEFCADCGHTVELTLSAPRPPIAGSSTGPGEGASNFHNSAGAYPYGIAPQQENPYNQYASPYEHRDTIAMYEAPGRKMIKVVSIIFIIFSGIVVLVSGCSLALTDVMNEFLVSQGEDSIFATSGMTRTAFYFSMAFTLVQSGLGLAIGIMGVKHCDDVTKAKMLGFMMYAYIALLAINWISGIVSDPSAILGLICAAPLGLVLPVLFLIGVGKNKSQAGF